MTHQHPLKSAMRDATVVEMAKRLPIAGGSREELERSVATVEAVGDMLESMQAQLESQAALIAGYKKEIRDLTMHKEAAYSEMSKAEGIARSERERADRAERMCAQLTASEREAQDNIKRLIHSVRTTFSRADQPITTAIAS